ncbi:MAG: hypothetical protein AAF587_38295 [Bacteroidota bacterium]
MKTNETHQQLFLSLGLKPINLPIGIRVWQITHSQADVMKRQLGNPSQIEEIKYYGQKYTWLSSGPTIFLIPEYWGIAFELETDAKIVIPRIRQQGYSEETSRWFLTMTGEEAREVLANTSHLEYPNRKEGKVYKLLEGKLGYLDCWTYSRAHWFPTLNDYKKYETSFLEIDALL